MTSPQSLRAKKAAVLKGYLHPTENQGYAGLASEYGATGFVVPPGLGHHRSPVQVVREHENMHLMLNRVQVKYGREGRRRLVANLLEAMPSQYRNDVLNLGNKSYTGIRNPMNFQSEEWLTTLMDFLNSKGERTSAFQNPTERREVHTKMKRAYNAVRAAAAVATPAWTQVLKPWAVRANNPPGTQVDIADVRGPFGPYAHTKERLWDINTLRPPQRLWTGQYVGKAEVDLVGAKALEPGEKEAALLQLGHDPQAECAFEAAQFLSGRKVKYDDEKYSLALQVYEGDVEKAALYAVGITPDEKNIKALQAVMKMGKWDEQTPEDLSKAEDLPATPPPPPIESVQPAVPEAEGAADVVGRAVTAGLVQPLKLKGKHVSGATAVRDPQTNYVLLLKPGSGKQSPAAGSRDDSSSQSAREAAFWHVADLCGMGKYYPRADLLIVNAQQWAAMAMLGPKWKGLDEYNRTVDGQAREILLPYFQRGDVHRLAILDGILGNPDSHGMNLLTHANSVALIDHGSAFAGPNFDPGHDVKSFIPYYLRIFAGRSLSKLPPEQRVPLLPVLGEAADKVVRDWVKGLQGGAIDEMMKRYGIGEVGRKAVLSRLARIQSYDGDSLSGFVNRLWAGVEDWEMKR